MKPRPIADSGMRKGTKNALTNYFLETDADILRLIEERKPTNRPWFSHLRNLGWKKAEEIHKWLSVPMPSKKKPPKIKCPHCNQIIKQP